MYSIRTKTTLLTVCAIVAAMTAATLLSVISVRNIGNSSSNQMIYLLCQIGQKNLDSYFQGVSHSVDILSEFVEADLDGLQPEQLESHLERIKPIFKKTAYKTNGVLTFYYRIDPEIFGTVEGFWFIRQDKDVFEEHEVTDITLYDTSDTSQLVWFTVPKATGKSLWLPPYITENLNARVISYNVPIYWEERFIGVVGIEIDYSTLAEQVDNIRFYDNGYAFLSDAYGNLIYHPRIDVPALDPGDRPPVPDGFLNSGAHFQYVYEGVEKQAVWLPLSNGMRLNVAAPVAEVNSVWHKLISQIFSVSILLLLVFIILTLRLTGQITRPLQELTEVAKQVNEGNYDVKLNYRGHDEVGLLTRTFAQLVRHLKIYINDLSNMAYADALTSVRNKGAFDIYSRDLQARLASSDEPLEFAVGVFDCDNLKTINDQYGHDKGDIYLKTASGLICRVFQHSPVFRTGGDEFTVILQHDDYRRRAELARQFETLSAEICAATDTRWEQVRVSAGVAVFDPENDRFVVDVVRRADKMMYENKRRRKAANPI